MTRDRDAALFLRMLKLPVASFVGHLEPAVGFDPFDDVPYLHVFIVWR
jgi:hypothetical protein